MPTRFKVRLSLLSLFCLLAMLLTSITLIFSSPTQNLGTTFNISYLGTDKVQLGIANNEGSMINSDTVSVIMNEDETKFKIVGPDTTSLSNITNNNGSEFYYFSTNSDVLNTTGYTSQGDVYYLSSSGTSIANNGYKKNILELINEEVNLTSSEDKEYWYEVKPTNIYLYPVFMTPNNTTGDKSGGATREVIISHSVTTMPNNAFQDSTGMTNCIIPETITAIPTYAFYGCTNLKNIEIPNTITSLGTYAFYNCKLLDNINFPQNISIIPDRAFYNCTAFSEELTIANGVKSIGAYSFYNCTSLPNIIIGSGVTTIYASAFSGCSSLQNIIIPDSVTTIETDVFSGCSLLSSISIGAGVTSIGVRTFSGCNSLENVIVTNGNTKFSSAGNCIIETAKNSLFLGCKNSTIPTDGSVTIIGAYAFFNCSSLISIIIPDNVVSIENGAFYGCSNMSSITIGSGVTNIGNYAFNNCINLSNVHYGDAKSQWQSITIWSNNDKLTGATIHYLHGWTLVSVQSEPSCTEEGSGVYEKNGVQKHVSIPVLGHNADENGICTRCGEEVPFYTITKSNGANYEFVEASGVYTSNNKGINSSTASTTLIAGRSFDITITWTVSSETNWDKFTIRVNSTTQVNAVSGIQNGSFTVSLSAGDTITFIYAKDSSGNSNDDCATFQISY